MPEVGIAGESLHADLIAAALCVWQGHIVLAAAMLFVCCCRRRPRPRSGLPQWPLRPRRTCSTPRCRRLHPARAALLVHTASRGPSGQELPGRCRPCRCAFTLPCMHTTRNYAMSGLCALGCSRRLAACKRRSLVHSAFATAVSYYCPASDLCDALQHMPDADRHA